ncbi:unnamed protein product [Fraxinus pennsylvanica]|uniref:Uncharacterized protein n=1 Tax=Fraxinus pennsylvanica TaxID=56036 RepID=A0AAD1YWU2_9LAMI|nr:unnamed protein product [Fraxinus pennsylvanica]
MSRCFQFPPPECRVKETWREALIEKIKIQKQREKAMEEKRTRREEKQKRREKKEKTNQLLERSCNIEKVWVDTKDGHLYKERKDGSSLTEECGLPTFLLIPTPSSETESTENSSKRKRNSRHGDTIVLQLAVKKQKRDTLYNEERTDILPQFKDAKFCTISEGIGNNGQGFPQTDEAIKCSISEQTEATAQGKSGIQSSNAAYKNLFQNWDPLSLLAVQLDPDEDWLFRGKGQNIHSDKRLKSCSNSISIPCSSTLWPHSQFLPEADIYALPFTVPL